MIELSTRVKTMTSSPTLKLVQIKKQLQAQGKVILDFGAGEPDFPTPENIKNAGIAAIQNNFTKYTPTSGIAELKKAIQASYQAEQEYARHGQPDRGLSRQQIRAVPPAAGRDRSRGRGDRSVALSGFPIRKW